MYWYRKMNDILKKSRIIRKHFIIQYWRHMNMNVKMNTLQNIIWTQYSSNNGKEQSNKCFHLANVTRCTFCQSATASLLTSPLQGHSPGFFASFEFDISCSFLAFLAPGEGLSQLRAIFYGLVTKLLKHIELWRSSFCTFEDHHNSFCPANAAMRTDLASKSVSFISYMSFASSGYFHLSA